MYNRLRHWRAQTSAALLLALAVLWLSGPVRACISFEHQPAAADEPHCSEPMLVGGDPEPCCDRAEGGVGSCPGMSALPSGDLTGVAPHGFSPPDGSVATLGVWGQAEPGTSRTPLRAAYWLSSPGAHPALRFRVLLI